MRSQRSKQHPVQSNCSSQNCRRCCRCCRGGRRPCRKKKKFLSTTVVFGFGKRVTSQKLCNCWLLEFCKIRTKSFTRLTVISRVSSKEGRGRPSLLLSGSKMLG